MSGRFQFCVVMWTMEISYQVTESTKGKRNKKNRKIPCPFIINFYFLVSLQSLPCSPGPFPVPGFPSPSGRETGRGSSSSDLPADVGHHTTSQG